LIVSQKINYQGINLTKEVKDLCNENSKTLKKETEENTEVRRTFHIHYYTITSNIQIQCSPHKNSNVVFHRIEKSVLKLTKKHKKPQIAKAILSKNSNAEDVTRSDFKLYYKAIIATPP
jgi:hypothetical protein